MKNLTFLGLSVAAVVSLEPFLKVSKPAPSGGRSFQFETDEYLTHAKVLFGSEDRTGFLQLDFHSEYTFVTGFDCQACVVQTYNSATSDSVIPGSNERTSVNY